MGFAVAFVVDSEIVLRQADVRKFILKKTRVAPDIRPAGYPASVDIRTDSQIR